MTHSQANYLQDVLESYDRFLDRGSRDAQMEVPVEDLRMAVAIAWGYAINCAEELDAAARHNAQEEQAIDPSSIYVPLSHHDLVQQTAEKILGHAIQRHKETGQYLPAVVSDHLSR